MFDPTDEMQKEAANTLIRRVKKISKEAFIANFYNNNVDRLLTTNAENFKEVLLNQAADSLIDAERRGIFRGRFNAAPKSRKMYLQQVNWYLRKASDNNLCNFEYKKRKTKTAS